MSFSGGFVKLLKSSPVNLQGPNNSIKRIREIIKDNSGRYGERKALLPLTE